MMLDDQSQNNEAHHDSPNEERQKKKGRGWHGDRERHAIAGRKGGLARRRKNPT